MSLSPEIEADLNQILPEFGDPITWKGASYHALVSDVTMGDAPGLGGFTDSGDITVKLVRSHLTAGVPAERGFQPLHRQGLLASEGFRKATGSTFDYAALRLPDAERWSETAVVLPGRLLLGDAGHVGAIVEAFQKVAGAYAR